MVFLKEGVKREMLKLTVTLLSNLCAGNGESLGNRVDTDVIMDKYGMPLIPARRLKGVLRESADLLAQNAYQLKSGTAVTREMVDALFGTPEKQGLLVISDAVLPDYAAKKALLNQLGQKDEADAQNVTAAYTTILGQTRMENGMAAEGSLRYTRVVRGWLPDLVTRTSFEAEIQTLDQDDYDLLEAACKITRHIGTHRARGLGLVRMTLAPDAGQQKTLTLPKVTADTVTWEYQVRLDSDMVLDNGSGNVTAPSARTVIGAMCGTWLKMGHQADAVFDDLFQNGKTCWSALTPVINGLRSEPASLMYVYLKYAAKYASTYQLTEEEKKQKQKTLEGLWMASNGKDAWIAETPVGTAYHHRHEHSGVEAQLYTQNTLPSGLLYSGTVTFPKELAEEVGTLLKNVTFRFGRSRSAQYAKCSVVNVADASGMQDQVSVKAGEPVYVTLTANLLPVEDGLPTPRPEVARQLLAEKLGLPVELPADLKDMTETATIGGYQAMWHLFKPQQPIIAAGSVFCFRADRDMKLDRFFQVGGSKQEGFGVCRVDTDALLPISIKKAEIDKAYDTSEQKDPSFHGYLLTELAVKVAQHSAVEIAKDNKTRWAKKSRRGLMNRLRLLAAQSASPEDMKREINQFSDENEHGDEKKKFCLDVFEALFGDGGERDVVSGMLAGDEDLCAKVLADPMARPLTAQHWQEYASTVLHLVYYANGGDGE